MVSNEEHVFDGQQPVLGGGDKQDKLQKRNCLQDIPHETF